MQGVSKGVSFNKVISILVGRTDSLCSLAKVQTYYDCMHQHALIHGIV